MPDLMDQDTVQDSQVNPIEELLRKQRLQQIAAQMAPQFEKVNPQAPVNQMIPQGKPADAIANVQSIAPQQVQEVQGPQPGGNLPVTGFDDPMAGKISDPSGPPESQNMDPMAQYKRAVAAEPQKADQPEISKKRRLAGILLGATQGLANQGAGSTGEQMRRGVFDAPYNKVHDAWQQNLDQKQQLANIQVGEEGREQKRKLDIAKMQLEEQQGRHQAALAQRELNAPQPETHEQRAAREEYNIKLKAFYQAAETNPPHFDPITGMATVIDKRGNVVSRVQYGKPGMTPQEHLKAQQDFTAQQNQFKEGQSNQRALNAETGRTDRFNKTLKDRTDRAESKPLTPAAEQEKLMQLKADPNFADVIGTDEKNPKKFVLKPEPPKQGFVGSIMGSSAARKEYEQKYKEKVERVRQLLSGKATKTAPGTMTTSSGVNVTITPDDDDEEEQ